ncbi:radical SAM protein [Candidatus Dojkabacteria bacterium]|nr:radical SAM protein [Candidatus Dojkabacteria bacterium]
MSDTGYINSIETLGALDGPGIRTVVFFQGCGLKCKFCHNPECIEVGSGKEISVDELYTLIIKNKPYFGKYEKGREIKGGVTFSGGEPTLQSEFVANVAKKLRVEDIHLAIDSCLFTSSKNIESLIPEIDYWMVSIKHMDPAVHKELTGFENNIILDNIKLLDSRISGLNSGVKIRIRYLLLPGITDTKDNIERLIEFLKSIKNLDCIEILGYGSHAKDKWIKLFGKYELSDLPDATQDDIERIASVFRENGFEVLY